MTPPHEQALGVSREIYRRTDIGPCDGPNSDYCCNEPQAKMEPKQWCDVCLMEAAADELASLRADLERKEARIKELEREVFWTPGAILEGSDKLKADLQQKTDRIAELEQGADELLAVWRNECDVRVKAEADLRHVTEERQKLVKYARHEDACESHRCLVCGLRDAKGFHDTCYSAVPSRHDFQGKDCTCGLAALLRPEAQEEEQKG